MSSKIWGVFVVLTLVVACGSDDDSGSGGGGSSGKGGTDGGKGGSGGTSAGGTSAGGTSAGGTSAGGTSAGGTAAGGTAGASGGQAGQGGSAGAIVKDVPCDNGAACPVNPGHCCFNSSVATNDAGASDAGGDAATPSGAICQGDNGQCSGTTISCNNKKDCNGLNVCCLKVTLSSGAGEAKCMKPNDCKDTAGGDGGVTVQATQLCDPAQTTPTECIAGSCQAFTGSALPSGYNGCQS